MRRTLTLVLLLWPVALCAQQSPSTPTLRVTSRLVVLDTVVTDDKGQPVPDLTAADFRVYEDKDFQTIVSFEAATQHGLPSTTTVATKLNPAQPQSFGNSPVTILVLDEVNTHFADSAYAIRSLRDYLNKQPSTLTQPTSLLVVRDSAFVQLSGFTLDREALLKALAANRTANAWQLEQSMSAGYGVAERLDRSISALQQIAQNASLVRGHKNIIWVGAGFPSVDPDSLTPGTETMLHNMIQHTTDLLLATRSSLYAVDPTNNMPSTTEVTDDTTAAFALGAGGGGRMMDPFSKTADFDKLGPTTGGGVVRGLNGVDHLIDLSIRAGASYYTIGYRPTSTSETPGQFRHISVICIRPGVKVRTSNGYYAAGSATPRANDTISFDLNDAATSTLPLYGVDFTVEPDHDLTPTATLPISAKASPAPINYLVHVRSLDLTWTWIQEPAGGRTANIEMLAVLLSADNKVLAHTLHSETANATPEQDPISTGQTARFTVEIPQLPAGSKREPARIRLVVRDTATGRMGTQDLQLPSPAPAR